jgi:photosystem II stability/assembly factor-like uncharacterized protein
MKKIILIMLMLFLGLYLTRPILAQWKKVPMPGALGGAVYSICVQDSNLYAGIQGGVYVSKDDGAHWLEVNPDLPPRENNEIVMSLVATNENIIAAFNEPGVYVFGNGGNNWSKANINEDLRYTPFVIAANESLIIGGNFLGNTYKSYDNGMTWEKDSLTWVNSLAVKDSLVLAESILAKKPGIFLSTNYGLTWNYVHSFSTSNITSRSAIAFSGFYAFAGAGNYILLSTDRGLTWNDSSYLNCNSINSIVSSPSDTGINYIFAGTDSGVFRSSNNGAEWLQMNNGLGSKLIFSLAFKTIGITGNPVLYAGTGNGIFKTTNYGESWSAVGSPIQWIFTSTNSDIVAVSSNNSYESAEYQTVVYHSSNSGENWEKEFSGYLYNRSEISSIGLMNNNGKINLFTTIDNYNADIYPPWYSNVLMSDDFGKDWEKIYPDTTNRLLNLKINGTTIFLSTISPNDNIGNYLFRSTNNGVTWEKIDSGSISAIAFNENETFIGRDSIKFSSSRPVTITQYNEIKSSTDYGLTWKSVTSPLSLGKVIKNTNTDTLSTISSLYAKNSDLLVGMEANNFEQDPYSTPYAYGGGLFHLVNSDTNWTITDSAFINRSVFNFAANGSNIYAATNTGVFNSYDNGKTWNDISSGMNNIYVSSLFISGDYLYARTINGLWRRPLSEITSINNPPNEEIPKNFRLAQNYPNPFNPTTTIKYSISKADVVSLKIYDVLGRVVANVINKYEKPGEYSVQFNVANLSSGVYFYRLKAGDNVSVKKMVLLK